jgi:amidohydrolase
VLREVPGCYFFLGSMNRRRGLVHPHHSPRFDFDESALPTGVELWLRLAERFAASA